MGWPAGGEVGQGKGGVGGEVCVGGGEEADERCGQEGGFLLN